MPVRRFVMRKRGVRNFYVARAAGCTNSTAPFKIVRKRYAD
jgi:hypothetical protein